jgi:hypothetical protein
MPTTKDFVAIAGILCRNKASAGLVSDITQHYATQNPRFNASRFEDAAHCRVGASARRR